MSIARQRITMLETDSNIRKILYKKGDSPATLARKEFCISGARQCSRFWINQTNY